MITPDEDERLIDVTLEQEVKLLTEACRARENAIREMRRLLRTIHSALDDALGDTDITHIEDDDELRREYPVQWAAQRLAGIIGDQ